MSVQRISVPGQPTTLIDLGPSVARRTFTRGMVYGGVMVVATPARKAPQTPEQIARGREIERRYYERNRERLLQEQRERRAVPCGKWMILARVECARKARHAGSCASRSSMDAENLADRKR